MCSQRFRECVQNPLVQIGILPGKLQRDVLAAVLGNIPHHAGKTPEELFDRHHANLKDGLVQFVQHASLERKRIRQLGANRIFGVRAIKFCQRPVEHRFADDQLADQVHHGIDTGGIHAQRAFRNRRDSGAQGAGFAVAPLIAGIRNRGIDLGCVGIEKVRKKFVFRGLLA